MTNETTLIENDALALPVQGRHLKGPRLEDNLKSDGARGALLVFLRHLGCTFCRQMVSELRSASTAPDYPAVMFVHQGTEKEGESFFSTHWPEASAIADPGLKLYRTFRISRGDARQLVGPEALLSGLKGLVKGHGIGIPMGDPLMMPGVFLIKNNEIVWEHEFKHAGDHPDFRALPK